MNDSNLKLWVYSEQLAVASGLPAVFFYGIARFSNKKPGIQEILEEPDSELAQRLQRAVTEKIIPETDWRLVQRQLDELRLNAKLLQEKRMAIQLISEANGRPLEYFKANLFQIQKNKDLGELWTTENGVAIFRYLANKQTQQFRLKVSDFRGKVLLETEIAQSDALVSVRVQIAQLESDSPAIVNVSRAIGIELPEGLAEFLEERKILSLRDLLSAGGFGSIADLPVPADLPILKRMDAHAELSVTLSGYQPEDVEKLVDGGYDSVQKIAVNERIRFVRQMGKDLGNYKAASLWKRAKASQAVLDNMLTSIRTGAIPLNGNDENNLETIAKELHEQSPHSCHCESCSTAVSPTAYLADLIKYAEEHLQVGVDGNNSPIMAQLGDLEAAFHQPFGELPLSCKEVTRKIRQVRLCIEVLRRYMRAQGLPAPGSSEENGWNEAYRNYLETSYSFLLASIGTSFEDLREAFRSDNSDNLKAIANRISIPESIDLTPLFLDPDTCTEADLEHLFGLKDTTGDVLSEGILMNNNGDFLHSANAPVSRWNLSGVRWRKNTDPNGYIYLSVKKDAAVFRVEVFKDANRSERLASGETDSAAGTVVLLPASDSRSGLYGSIQLNYTEDREDVKLSAVPLVLSWRLQWLYQNHWSSGSDQPVIDPDLIGAEYLLLPIEDNAAIDLWQARKSFIAEKLAAFGNVSGNDDVSKFNQLLTIVGIELTEDEDELLPRELEFLQNIQAVISPPDASPLLEKEWEKVFTILVQVEKRRRAANWLDEENQAGISLTPDFFQIPEFFADEQLPEWRAKWDDLQGWRNTLRSRLAEKQELVNHFENSVDQVEETNLMMLRDGLIQASDATGDGTKTKAEWITERLLINARMDSCMLTTRVAQAIDTLQQLVWSIHTGQLADTHPDWNILSDHFDEEWKWMGSYATWKAAMTVFLYPENVLHPALRRHKTPAFERIIAKFRNTPRLTPQDACQEARRYEGFLNDLPNLKIEATCHARVLDAEKTCGKNSSPTSSYRFFLFARAEDSGKVYMSSYRLGAPTGNEQTLWVVIPQLSDVVQVVGACVYEFEAEKSFRFIYIFAKEKQGPTEKLVFIRYDLEARQLEEAGPFPLDIPNGAITFHPVIKQKNNSGTPPELAIQVEGKVNFFQFNEDGLFWGEKDNPITLSSPGKVLAALDLNLGPKKDDPKQPDFLLIWKNENDVFCSFSQNIEAYLFRGKWKGAIFWPGWTGTPNIIYLFYEEDGLLHYKAIFYDINTSRIVIEPATVFESLNTIPALNELESIAVHTSAQTQQGVLTIAHQIAFQLKGENAGPYLGFFIRNLDGSNNSSVMPPAGDTSGLNSTLFSNSTTLRWRIENTRLGHIQDGIFIDSGDLDIPPQPPPEPPDPPLLWYLPIFFVDSIRLAPIIREEIEIIPAAKQQDLQARKARIEALFADNQSLSASHLTYLEEGFYFVPIYMAINLQRRGFYLEALEWFKTVYDFTAPEAQRKIYYGLLEEESLAVNYERTVNWLLDPLNPHAIAQNRPNTYTRFTLLSIVQCLAAFADSEFTNDTAESISRASTLYRTALGLLKSVETLDQAIDCQSIILNLAQNLDSRYELEEAFKEDVLSNLGKIKNLNLMRETVNAINASLEENSDGFKIMRSISDAVNKAVYRNTSSRKSLTEMSVHSAPKYKALMRYPQFAHIVEEVVWTVEQDFDYTFSALTGRKKTDLQAARLSWLEKSDQPISIQRPLATFESRRTIRHFETIRNIAKDAPNTVLSQNQAIPLLFTPGNGYDFCVPPNLMVQALKNQVELNLEKILQCRNIAGFKRDVEPYTVPIEVGTGLPALSDFGGIVLPNANLFRPTLYRYIFLVERARQMANFAQQIEAAFLSILERRDAEYYYLLKAKQDVTLNYANVRLQKLRVTEARDGLVLSELQRDMARMQEQYLEELAKKEDESDFSFYSKHILSLAVSAGIIVLGAGPWGAPFSGALLAQGATGALGSIFTLVNGNDTSEDLKKKLLLARQDVKISNRQIRLALDRINIVNQELNISNLQANHAHETLEFLTTKFTNLDLYEWMSAVLENVYSTILQQATAVAQLAAQQLAFEGQQPIPRFIQANYWEAPLSMDADLSTDGNAPDRKGLTGSARLLKDIILLETHAFDTEQRKQQLTKAISLARFSPAEFQLFRETGKMTFEIPMELFDRDFPGHYLRLIKRLRISLIALIPPIEGIKASLRTSGISRVVINDNGHFEETTIQRLPEKVDYTVPLNATGQFEFELQQQNEMLRPFEGNGVAGSWELELPKPANNFDFNTIADVHIKMEYTALHSDVYRQQIIQRLNRTFSADRPFSFKYELADQWYDLNNPEETASPMVVKFKTGRKDFPPNVDHLKIQQVVLYFSRADGETEEINIDASLFFIEQGKTDEEKVGGTATASDGIISTRRSNGNNWTTMQGKSPIGEWVLSFDEELSSRFKNNKIEDILFVITFQGETPEWPKLPA